MAGRGQEKQQEKQPSRRAMNGVQMPRRETSATRGRPGASTERGPRPGRERVGRRNKTAAKTRRTGLSVSQGTDDAGRRAEAWRI